VFVLTSIAFTLIIEGIGKLIFRRKRPPSIMGGGLERINHNRPNGGF
jgi:hypothetical protein